MRESVRKFQGASDCRGWTRDFEISDRGTIALDFESAINYPQKGSKSNKRDGRQGTIASSSRNYPSSHHGDDIANFNGLPVIIPAISNPPRKKIFDKENKGIARNPSNGYMEFLRKGLDLQASFATSPDLSGSDCHEYRRTESGRETEENIRQGKIRKHRQHREYDPERPHISESDRNVL